MILEEATKEVFGYYPIDLKPKSSKRILAACDNCGEERTVRNDSYRAVCRSCAAKGNSNALGHVCTEEAKVLMCTMKDKKCSVETKALMSASHIGIFEGRKNPMFGKHSWNSGKQITEEHRANLSASHIGIQAGDKHPNWQGGISFEPYCVKFNEEFKEYIRLKFDNKCFLCPTTQAENGKKLSVHHVNYNKKCGCDGDETCNFVPLCKKCHAKTNFNRDYWQKRIMKKLHNMIIGWNV